MTRTASLATVVVSAACFATLAVLTTLAYEGGATPLPLLTWRFALVTLLMTTYLLLRSPRALVVSRGDVARYAALSLTGYGAASVCFFFALGYVTASVVAVLLYTYPAMVAVAGWVVLGEPFAWQRVVAVLVTFAGCALVLDPFAAGNPVRPLGVVLGLGAAAGYAAFNVGSHRWLGRRPRLVLMTYTFGISALAIGAVTLLAGQSLSPAGWGRGVWVPLLLIVSIPTFAAVVLYLQGIRGLGAPQAAVVSTFEPVFTIILAAIVLGERLAAVQWFGTVLVLTGVVASEIGRGRTEDIAAV